MELEAAPDVVSTDPMSLLDWLSNLPGWVAMGFILAWIVKQLLDQLKAKTELAKAAPQAAIQTPIPAAQNDLDDLKTRMVRVEQRQDSIEQDIKAIRERQNSDHDLLITVHAVVQGIQATLIEVRDDMKRG